MPEITARNYTQGLSEWVGNMRLAAELAQKDREQEVQSELAKYLQSPELKGKQMEAEQGARNKANLATLQDPSLQDQLNQGGSIGVGDIHVGADPYAKMSGKAAQQAMAFTKMAQGIYKPINDQLSASKDTIDLLDQKNAASDKLALINEARLGAGMGGSRALAQLIPLITGGKTAASDVQGFMNYLNNTPNIPTLQDAQRDALRESVYGRLPHLTQMHQQAQTQLGSQGPVLAPTSDYGTIIKSFGSPVDQNLGQLQQMAQAYKQARAQAAAPGQPRAISNPSHGDAAPTTLDRLMSFFGKAPASQPQDQGQAPMSFEDWKKANGR